MPSKSSQFKNISLIQGNQLMTLLEKIELAIKYKPISYGKCMIYFFSTSFSAKNGIGWNALL